MHLNEDDLILHYYGEAGAREAGTEAHLASCGACRTAFEGLRRVMETIDAAAVPEPGPAFERQVWGRLAPSLPESPAKLNPARFSRFSWPILHVNRENRAGFNFGRLVLAGGLAAVLLVVVTLRFATTGAPAPGTAAADAGAHRERVMLAAVSEHIEQSQVVLVELANTEPRSGAVDVSLERNTADDLVSAGRLYRETAIETGNMQLAALLEDLEMVLVEIARGPEALSADDLAAIRRQIETQELIFKLQVLGADIKARRQAGTQPTSQRTL